MGGGGEGKGRVGIEMEGSEGKGPPDVRVVKR